MADGERFAGHSFPWAFPGFEKVGLAMLQVMANKAANCLVGCDAYSKSKKLLPIRRWADMELCCSSRSLGKRETFRTTGSIDTVKNDLNAQSVTD